MNFLSMNVRGIGEEYKVKWVRRLRSQHMVSFLALQETQLHDAENIDVSACWGSGEVDSARINATGRSGGLLHMWDTRVFSQSESISNRNFIATVGHWVGIQEQIIFVNVYGPQSIPDKEALWVELTHMMKNKGGIWILLGDFNVVRRSDERFNSIFCARSARDFNHFIHENGLIYMRMGDIDLHIFEMAISK